MKDMPKTVIRWYKMWIGGFPKSWHPNDMERFYMFVNVLLACSKKERDRYWLKENLKGDCPNLSVKDIEEYCNIYIHIKDYINVCRRQEVKRILIKEKLEELEKKYKSKILK